FEEAACLLLAQVGYNGAFKPAVGPGDTAVVIGDGLVGQYAAQVLKFRGARTIISGLSPERLSLAERYSADEVYDNRNFDFTEHMGREYPGGVDIVLDTASMMKTVREGAEMLKRHGQLVLNGYYPPGDSCIDWHWLRRKELTLYCADSRSDERLQGTMELMERKALRAGELVTHDFLPEEAPKAYAMLLEDRQDFLGMLIKWAEEKK
ncbi:MAG: zinc-binding dehydrogenase, partial [Spirochaetia bacterium]